MCFMRLIGEEITGARNRRGARRGASSAHLQMERSKLWKVVNNSIGSIPIGANSGLSCFCDLFSSMIT